ncbi:MAG: VOC family protein [Gemmatimonadota bacterium]|nr:VOC family protein [Gemmatimonadota bacterium]
MLTNRSIPDAIVMPVLGYADVAGAVTWLCRAFGFTERMRIADHRSQLNVGANAALVVAESTVAPPVSAGARARGPFAVMVRVEDVDAHYRRALAHGAVIDAPPVDHPFGERQYSALDFGGHAWTFTQTIADIAPESFGAVLLSG